tara:strand:- start:4637 stop:5041 length:405 start_codon:yes stop_codon:yes gene_type:complete
MAVFIFPNIKPSGRSYSPGSYPQTEFKSQNGTKTIVRYGNKRVDATLALTFSNITDIQAALILDNYETVNSEWNSVLFNTLNAAAGAGESLALYLTEKGGSGLRWRYASPPKVDSVYPGLSTVSCEFVAVLDGD